MEPHKELSLTDALAPDLGAGPDEYFARAREFVGRHYPEQLADLLSARLEDVTPELFFREYAWVVHATGFSAKAVGRLMPRLLRAYGEWGALGLEPFEPAFLRVKDVCNNRRKAEAVWRTAGEMTEGLRPWEGGLEGRWTEWRRERLSSPEKLRELPHVGPVTCLHLARNIGMLECVKPDLHLVRMAEHWGFPGCAEMCESVRGAHESRTGERLPLGIVDLVLWYAASTWGTVGVRKDGRR